MKLFKKKNPIDWNLDYEFICWLNKNLKQYLKNASKHVDLTFHKFNYKGKTYNQSELITILIAITDDLRENYFDYAFDKDVQRKANDMLDIFKLIFPSLWW